ncbi:MAG: helix-turn-helix domain-containing protein [bacterium]
MAVDPLKKEKAAGETNSAFQGETGKPSAFERFTRNFQNEDIKNFFRKVPEELLPLPDDAPRHRIIEAARIVFAEKGYDAATTRDIAEHAGVNQAMIHYYFGSKRQLYQRTLITQMYLLFGTIAPKIDARKSPIAFVVNFPLLMIDTFRDHPVWMNFMRRELASGGEGLQEMIEGMDHLGPKGFKELFRPMFEQGVHDGQIRDFDFDSVFQFVLSIAYAILIVDPLFKQVTNTSVLDDDTWRVRRPVWESILRYGIEPRKES